MSITVGIIGLGGIAQKAYLPVLPGWEGIELVLNSRNPQALAQYQAQYRLKRATTRLEELLDWQPQAAFVLTPSKTHFEIVERLLLAGIDVFVEKPLTLNLDQARRLAELADQQGRILMVGFNRRYAPLHRQARQLWGDRPVQMAVLQKNRSSAYHPNLYNNYIDDTIHIIDLLRFFCGDGQAAHTLSQVRDGKLVGAASSVAYAHGGFGLVLTSLQAGRWDETYALHGGSASLRIEAFSRLELLTESEHKVWSETYASAWKTTLKARGFVDEIAHFFECVQSREKPETDGWEAYRTQQLLEDMLQVAV